MRFNIGDEVRRIKEPNGCDSWTLHVGAVGIVAKIHNSGFIDLRAIRDNKGCVLPTNCGGHAPEYFELVRTAAQVRAAQEAKLRAFERDRIPARKTDPSTSQQAAKPKRTGLRQQVLNVICGGHYEPRDAGWTGHEIAELLGVGLNSVTPRFAELRKAGQIKDSGQRRDGQIVWVLA